MSCMLFLLPRCVNALTYSLNTVFTPLFLLLSAIQVLFCIEFFQVI